MSHGLESDAGTDLAPPAAETLADILRWRAQAQGEREAFTFFEDSGATQRLCYADLDRRARVIAAALHGHVQPGDRVLLLLSPGPEYVAAFFGCFYAGCVAVPAYPPRRNSTLDRLESIARDTGASVVLATRSMMEMGDAAHRFAGGALTWLAADALDDAPAADFQPVDVTREQLAFLQYTSGSTEKPRGVMVSHQNLVHNSAFIYRSFGHSPDSRGVIWLPPYHDMGLIGGVLQPVYAGFPCLLMSPMTFLQRPIRWLQSVTRYRATTSGGPNFAYDLCLRRIKPEQLQELDLSSWSVAFNGAEPVAAETLERFAERFEVCGFRPETFYPCYGLAEATLMVTGVDRDAKPAIRLVSAAALQQDRIELREEMVDGAQTLVSSGRPAADQLVKVVDTETGLECEVGKVGEIWIHGPSVGQGYWERADATAETFHARLAGEGQRRYLRTGDLGVLLDGELFVTGRKKEMLIIRGRNYYPHDLEATAAASHPAILPDSGAAFTVPVQGDERLVLIHEIDKRAVSDPAEIIWAIRQKISEAQQLQVYGVVLLRRRALPKTTSGKIQRRYCRQLYLEQGFDAVARWQLDLT